MSDRFSDLIPLLVVMCLSMRSDPNEIKYSYCQLGVTKMRNNAHVLALLPVLSTLRG